MRLSVRNLGRYSYIVFASETVVFDDYGNQSIDIPIWKRYLLSVTEAAQFYHIGEKRLRQIVDIHPNGEFYLLLGNKVLFKKEQFEQFLAESTAI